jgi:short-subunit dehydrogenase
MAKTLIVCGYGSGISSAVAERFGQEGFNLALVARNAARLEEAVKRLTTHGVTAAAFPADLSDATQLKAMISSVKTKFGPITAIHWNAYSMGAGNLLTADAKAIRSAFELPVTSLILAIQSVLSDLQSQPGSAVLVTNGGLGLYDPQVDAMAVAWNAMDLAVVNAAKHKLVGLMAEKLKPSNVYVGEVLVMGPVKGTAWDQGNATIEAKSVAEKFWELYTNRTETSAQVS